MATACLRLVTFLPLRPDFSSPRLNSCISRLTSFPADAEYLRPEDFLDEDFFAGLEDFFALLLFFAGLFFAALLRAMLGFFALDFFVLDFFALDFFVLDFFVLDFFWAFLVAIAILPRIQMFQATPLLSAGKHNSPG